MVRGFFLGNKRNYVIFEGYGLSGIALKMKMLTWEYFSYRARNLVLVEKRNIFHLKFLKILGMLFEIVLWNPSFKLKTDESVENFDSLNSLRYNYQFDNYDGFDTATCVSHTHTHTHTKPKTDKKNPEWRIKFKSIVNSLKKNFLWIYSFESES